MMQQSELSPKHTIAMKRQAELGRISQMYAEHAATLEVVPSEIPEKASEYLELLVEKEGKKLHRHVGQLIILVAKIYTQQTSVLENSTTDNQNKQLNETTLNDLRTLLELIKLEIAKIKSRKLTDTKKEARADVSILLKDKKGSFDLPKTNLFNKVKQMIATQVVALIGRAMSARDRETFSNYIVDRAITEEGLFPNHAKAIKNLDAMLNMARNPNLGTEELLQSLLYLLPGLSVYGMTSDFFANMFKFAQKETSS